jgi:phosphatidylglycerol:prolipoprotein diacylglycerol transferase
VYPYAFGVALYQPILALSLAVAVVSLLALIRRAGYPLRPVIGYVALLTVAALLGAKAYSVLFHGGMRAAQTELSGGLRFPGALFGVLASAWLLRGLLPPGLGVARFADLWAPGFALACAVGRLGCLATGCCHGAPAQLPWAIQYPRGSGPWWRHFEAGQLDAAAQASLPVHPLPVYLLAMELAVFAFLLWLLPRRSFDGQVVLAFLAVHGALKTAIEFTRDPYDPLHQVVVVAAAAAGASLWIQHRRLGRAASGAAPVGA